MATPNTIMIVKKKDKLLQKIQFQYQYKKIPISKNFLRYLQIPNSIQKNLNIKLNLLLMPFFFF